MEIFFATSNDHKFSEAEGILGREGIALSRFAFRHNEIRSDSLEEIANEAAHAAFSGCRKPVFVEDTGLFIDCLNGFPGTYSAWVQRKIGPEGILKLMQGIEREKRSAAFRSVAAFHDGNRVRDFPGECRGRIADSMQGKSGFGYDPIFIPEGHSQTFAQNIELKNKLSHRYQSLLELARHLKKHKSIDA